jgi:hypothetical protein
MWVLPYFLSNSVVWLWPGTRSAIRLGTDLVSFISAGETNPRKIFQTESTSCPLHPEACKRIQSLAIILTVRSPSEIWRGYYNSIVLGTSGSVCLNSTVIQWIIKINVDRFLLFVTIYIFLTNLPLWFGYMGKSRCASGISRLTHCDHPLPIAGRPRPAPSLLTHCINPQCSSRFAPSRHKWRAPDPFWNVYKLLILLLCCLLRATPK